jgi:hypothetical protein
MKRKYNIQGDITDEAANAEASARYYKEQLDRYGGDIRKAGMAYFAGPDNVDKGIIGPKTAAYGDAIAGSQGQATMQGGAGQDVPQPPSNAARMGLEGVPEWKLQGLLEQAGADGEGGMYDAQGNLTEATKRNLRISLLAGGPEGVQQALMQMANQKPEAFGTAETGYYLRYPNGQIKQLLAPQGKEQWEDVTDKVDYQVGPNTRIMRNSKTGDEKTLTTQPTGGVTVNLDTMAEKGRAAADMKRSTGWAESADKLESTVDTLQPTTEFLKEAVLNGKNVTGQWADKSLPLRQVLKEWGMPGADNVPEQELIKGMASTLMTAFHEPGMGSTSDWESRQYVASGISLSNSTEGNYILAKGLEAQAARKRWRAEQSIDYMDSIDPATGKARNNLKGFDTWLKTPVDGHKPIDDMPHLFTDTREMTPEQIKATKPGDVLFVDGQIKVRPREIPDVSKMTSKQQVDALPTGSVILLNGQLKVINR